MSLVRWRNKRGDVERSAPESPLRSLRTEMDRLFERFFDDTGPWPELFTGGREWAPALDVTETDRELKIRAELPGVDPKDIDVTISGNVLTITGEKKESSESESETSYRCERRFGRFQRSIELPASAVDTEHVRAENTNGVLTITLPRSAADKPRRIEVKPSKS